MSIWNIEYYIVLIMYLFLRKQKDKIEEIGEKTIQILQKIMDKVNIEVLTWIKGTLYSK